ncbi:MAG: hypothetical protein IPJ58_12185 [Ardenticatenia bacterium]|nr:hypothetical protein [Ardenticatenia bacterium]
MILQFNPRTGGPARHVGASLPLDGRQAFEHPSSMNGSELISTAEVCRRYGVSREAVRRWVADGLPLAPETPISLETGRPVVYLFRAGQVAAYVEARKAAGRWKQAPRGKDKAPRKPGRWPAKESNVA